jgi:putative membrane protein
MNRTARFFSSAFCILTFATLSSMAMAAMSGADFVDEASALGRAEIEGATVALSKTTSTNVKEFAQKMLDDHGQANEELTKIATKKNLKVASEADLMNKVKGMALKLRSGESFDEAYANNQIVAHEQTIALFRKALREVDDPDLKAFAKAKLPTLEQHLKQAKALTANVETTQ